MHLKKILFFFFKNKMYFDLPKNHDRKLNKQTKMPEERISEILNNIEDHWGSPPILTPDTLTFILNHQWENDKKVKKYIKKHKDKLTYILTLHTIRRQKKMPKNQVVNS